MSDAANYDCPNCDGRLQSTNEPQTYLCQRCTTEIREVVAETMDSWVRKAESDGPLQEIAEEALDRRGGQ